MNRFGRNSISKVYIDSRQKRPESASDTDFWIELPENIEMEQGTGMILSEITIPSTSYNINNNNNNFYFRSFIAGQELIAHNDFLIQLPPRNYNLAQLANQLMGLMMVAAGANIYTVNEGVQTGDITFGCFQPNLVTRILSDDELRTRVNGTWNGGFYDLANLRTINSMLRINNQTNDERSMQFGVSNVVTGLIDLNPIHNLYITSTKLSNYSTISLNGQRNIIKKVLVDAGFGGLTTYDYLFIEEAIDVSGLSLKLVDFQIRDAFGNIIDLNGAHVSFCLTFVRL